MKPETKADLKAPANRTGPRPCGQLWARAVGEGAMVPRPLAAPSQMSGDAQGLHVPASSLSLLLLGAHALFLSGYGVRLVGFQRSNPVP